MATYDGTVADFMPDGGGDMDPRIKKLLSLLFSRKFWALVIAVLTASGLVNSSDLQQLNDAKPLINAGIMLVGALGLSFGIALEDALKAIAEAIAAGVTDAREVK